MGAIIGLVLTGLAVYVAILAVVPTVSYVTRPTAGAESWINSTCDVFVTLSHSELLQYVKFVPGAEIDPNLTRHLPNETVSVHPQTLYRTLKRLSLLQWPFTGNATAEELLITLLRYLTSPVTQVESDCHADASYDPVNQCCFVSCPSWKWLTRAEEIADDVWFYINLVLSIVLVFVSTTTVVATKTKRRFPLIMIAWYLCLAASALNFSELVSRAMGRNNLMCCGSKDLFEAISSNCVYAIVYVIFYQFFFLVFTAWSALMAVNVVIIGLPHLADSFFVHLNRIHATELLLGWGIPAFLSILPFAIEGKNAYSNFAGICPTCFIRDRDLEYYTSVLPNQVFEILLGVVMGCIAIIKERKLRDRKKLTLNAYKGILH
ncbi:uncharacterized protein [Oscarella lobularis]|uniref:uncharacterized protein isoform X2 n=1 Tax=Oscarella lobularis TaxID=121494 RepID=UPI0033142DD9